MDFAATMTMVGNIMRSKPKTAIGEVQAQLDQNEWEIQANEALIGRLKEKQQQIEITASDEELDRLESELKKAERDLRRRIALRRELTDAISKLDAEQSRTLRQKNYDSAVRARDKLKADFERRYRAWVADGLALLGDLARVEQLINVANDDLPDDADPIGSVEFEMRALPGEADEVLNSEVLPGTWFFKNSGIMGRIDPRDVPNIRVDEGGRSGKLQTGERDLAVELRVFRETKVLVGRQPAYPQNLAAAISLPGFKADEAPCWDFWGAGGGDNATDVLAQVEAMRDSQRAIDPRPPRQTRIDRVRIDEEPKR